MARSLWKDRRHFIGGSDARIIMGDDEGALLRLWREKRGEVEPEDLSRRVEVVDGEIPVTAANEAAIRRALESAGIDFIDENGTGEGVRFRKPRRVTRK
jgi:predicted phage-related endonuclease